MTSQINPNNINTAYPVPGQDNNTKGFRDNFTNIKNNFVDAKDEITDLQNKVMLKQALDGTTLDNNMSGSLVYNAVLRDISTSTAQLGSPVSGSVNVNYAAAPYQWLSTGGNIVLVFDPLSFPVPGEAGNFCIEINVTNTAHTVTFPATVNLNNIGIRGLTVNEDSTSTITFAAIGIYVFEFNMRSGGEGGVTINESNKQLQPFNNSSEDLAPSAAASLAATTSYFSTDAAETATLAAGVEGQIKVFAMQAAADDMVITVTNPAWGGAGTITFAAAGNACTLQYINAKWFCIGNNGCVFA